MGSKRTKRETKIVDNILYQKCTKCEMWLEATEENFRYRSDRDTIHTVCRKCEVVSTSKYYREHIEEKREYRRNYHKEHKEEHKEWSEAYYKEYILRDGVREKRCENTRQWQEKNIEYRKEYTKAYNKIHGNDKALFSVYAHQLTIEESPKEGLNGELVVKCAYCGRYFAPTNIMISNRVRSLNRTSNVESRLYCSDGCKVACPIYNQRKFPKGFKPATSREVNPLLRQMALELDNYECQRCGRSIDEVPLHVHHILPYRKNPMMGNDIDNTLTLCVDCHLSWMHSKDGYGCVDTKCIS